MLEILGYIAIGAVIFFVLGMIGNVASSFTIKNNAEIRGVMKTVAKDEIRKNLESWARKNRLNPQLKEKFENGNDFWEEFYLRICIESAESDYFSYSINGADFSVVQDTERLTTLMRAMILEIEQKAAGK